MTNIDSPLTKDARGLVDGVVSYLKNEGKMKSVMPKVQAFLTRVTSQAKKEKIARIATSVELTQEEKKHVEDVLVRLLGHEVTLECVVQPQLVAGFRIQVGDWIVDTTLKSQLEKMATVLTN